MRQANRSLLKRSLLLGALAGVGVRHILRRSRYLPLQDKVAVVTGGSRGLGLLITRELLESGCRVVICSRSQEELSRAIDLLDPSGTRLVGIACDLSTEQGCRELADGVLKEFGTAHLLINNAGVILSAPFDRMTQADYAELMNVHFWAPYRLIESFLPYFRKNGEGRIVNISSIGGKIPVPHLLPYTTSKFALRGFSEGLRAELAKENVFVTTICPGLMRTGSQINALFKGDYEKEYAWFKGISAAPGISINAVHAARRIVKALQYGEAEVVIGASAQIADLAYGIAPNLVAAGLEIVDRVLPKGNADKRIRGREIALPKVLALATANIDAAAARNNE